MTAKQPKFFQTTKAKAATTSAFNQLIENSKKLEEFMASWQERKQGLEELQNEISDYCGDIQAEIHRLTALERHDPDNVVLRQSLAYCLREKLAAEELLQKTLEEIDTTERDLKIMHKYY